MLTARQAGPVQSLLQILNGDGATIGVQLAVGVGLLMLGRRLYWLFVAGVGFIVVLALANEYIDVGPDWLGLALAVAAGIAGGVFAIFLQWVAVSIAGFAAAAFLARELVGYFAVSQQVGWIVALVAGGLGAFFASVLFDWALILLSSLAGSVVLVDAFQLQENVGLVVIAVLTLAGVSIQANMLHRDRDSD